MKLRVLNIICEPPIQRKLTKENMWELVSQWRCEIHTNKGIYVYTIQAGYWWDLASIPKVFRSFVDNGSGKYGILVSTLLHDVNYDTHLMTRYMADKLLYAMMKYYRISNLTCSAFYISVWLFGYCAYKSIDPVQYEVDKQLCKLSLINGIT